MPTTYLSRVSDADLDAAIASFRATPPLQLVTEHWDSYVPIVAERNRRRGNVGTIMPTQGITTIDHGRLATLERRKKFANVHLRVTSGGGSIGYNLSTRATLSPRRIFREMGFRTSTGGGVEVEIADAAFDLLSDYRDSGYSAIDYAPVLGERVGKWKIALVSGAVA